MPPRLRSTLVLAGFLALTVPLMPVQWLLLHISPRAARQLPSLYHRALCRLIGLRRRVTGGITPGAPVLIVANHVSWLDIPLLSAIGPVTFVAKREVSAWPMVGTLARLQGVIFVDRQRRTDAERTIDEIAERLIAGGVVVLFAEGTSSDGASVRPFLSALFKVVDAVRIGGAGDRVMLQTLGLAYRRVHGLAVTRAERPLVSFYGDMDMRTNALAVLGTGPIEAHVSIGPPRALEALGDRKRVAALTEAEVRAAVVALNRETATLEIDEVAAP
ncbi:MAG TPA: lysophospholipid acyltransferase family protein, partial [Hyphomicrobiaceae bacterium]|nr:lysophospholipid acyltransferase family protein [Hyphomicrobiaceae bacterium]